MTKKIEMFVKRLKRIQGRFGLHNSCLFASHVLCERFPYLRVRCGLFRIKWEGSITHVIHCDSVDPRTQKSYRCTVPSDELNMEFEIEMKDTETLEMIQKENSRVNYAPGEEDNRIIEMSNLNSQEYFEMMLRECSPSYVSTINALRQHLGMECIGSKKK